MEDVHHEDNSELAGQTARGEEEMRDGGNAEGANTKRRKRSKWRYIRLVMWPVFLALAFVLGGYFAVENGLLDKPLKSVAYRVLSDAVGNDFDVGLANTVLRFGASGDLVVEARDVSFKKRTSLEPFVVAQKVRIFLDLAASLSGQISVKDVSVSGISLGEGSMGSMATVPRRVDSVPIVFGQVFDVVSGISKAVDGAGVNRASFAGLTLELPGLQERMVDFEVQQVELVRQADGSLAVKGDFFVGGKEASLTGRATGAEGDINAIQLSVKNFNLGPFASRWDRQGEPHLGLYGVANLDLELEQKDSGSGLPEFNMRLTLPDAAFYGNWEPVPVRNALLKAHYDFESDKIEIERSVFELAGARLPFRGGLIDADRVNRDGVEHIAVELLIDRAVSRTASMQEPPTQFSGKLFGDFDPNALTLKSDDIFISTAGGILGGSVALDFGKDYDPRFDGDSPEISLALYSDSVRTSVVKQLWPFWLGDKAREWAGKNLFAGTMRDVSLVLYLPSGRLPIYPDPVQFEENELQINFAMERGRINIAGDIPPMRDTIGTFHLAGKSVDVVIESGSAYFPSGRVVDLKGGTLSIPDIFDDKLMTDTEMRIAGPADAVGELATYRPIQVLHRIGYKPEDFSGYVTAELSARFPLLVKEGEDPQQDWKAQLALDNVAIAKPIGGKQISAVSGELAIDPDVAALDASVAVDGVNLQISMVEPLVENSGTKRQRTLSGVLNDADLAKLVPGLEQVVDGQVRMRVELTDENRQTVEADLSDAAVTIPWAGWTKGPGVPAKLSFDTTKNGESYEISEFDFSGSGFGAKGKLSTGVNGLQSVRFSSVKLSPEDSFSMTLDHTATGYIVNLKGQSADLRGMLYKIKTDGLGGGGDTKDIKLSARLGKAIGFRGEVLRNVDFDYETVGGRPVRVKLNAVSGNDQAVVIAMAKEGEDRIIEVTATDAGAFARFTGLYNYMYGGLLNQKMRYLGSGEWVGSIDIRRFELVNEKRFEQLVTTRTGTNGKSLNEAVRKNIDLKAQRFSRGNAQLSIKGGVFSVDRGVVRGEQVGATFQGVIRDKKGNMNMTGTFMPAYGLNRLFAELPLIGVILGNGRDKGLIGITFRLSGSFQSPKLELNPLSLIAPGVFRNIFEFQ